MDCLAQTLAGLKLFLDTLIDNHIGIHGHTQGQDETRNTRQSQSSSECGKSTEEQDDVGKKGDVGSQTRATVEEYHVDEHEQECDEEGNET